MAINDVGWRLYFSVTQGAKYTAEEVENRYKNYYGPKDVPFAVFGCDSLASFIATAPGFHLTEEETFYTEEESALKKFWEGAIAVNNKPRAIAAFAQAFRKCYPDNHVPVREKDNSLFTRFFLKPPPKIDHTCLLHVFSGSTSDEALAAVKNCFSKWKTVLQFHSRAVSIASKLPMFFNVDEFSELYYSKFGRTPKIGFMKMGFNSLEELLKWVPEFIFFEGAFTLRTVNFVTAVKQNPDGASWARDIQGRTFKGEVEEELKVRKLAIKRMKNEESQEVDVKEECVEEEEKLEEDDFVLRFAEEDTMQDYEPVPNAPYASPELFDNNQVKEEATDAGDDTIHSDSSSEGSVSHQGTEEETSTEEEARLLQLVLQQEIKEEEHMVDEMNNDGIGVQPLVQGIPWTTLFADALPQPSSKYESLGYYMACLLNEAERHGQDADELAARAIAAIRGPCQ